MQRDYKLDILRILSIVLVVFIHVSNIYLIQGSVYSNNYIFSLIYNSFARICVPLFFMISGSLLIREEYDKKKYFKRIFKFIFILILWSIIYLYFNESFELKNIKVVLSTSLLNARLTSRHLWFMYAIIGIYIALPFIQNMCKNMSREHENLFIFLWIILCGCSVIYIPLIRNYGDLSLDIEYRVPIIQGTYYLGYFVFGHIIYNRIKNKEIKYSNNLLFVLFISCTIITILTTFIESRVYGIHTDNMLWYTSVFTAISSICIFTIILNNNYKVKYTKFVGNLSLISFGVYLSHMLFLNKLVENFNILKYNALFYIPFYVLIVLILSAILCEILIHIPLLKKIIR